MGQQCYGNLILVGVKQSDLLSHLSSINCKSYVSPTLESVTTLYVPELFTSAQVDSMLQDLSFFHNASLENIKPELREIYQQHSDAELEKARASLQGLFNPAVLGPDTAATLKQYEGLPEGGFVCWAKYLSRHFACPVLAMYSRDEFHFWYHLSEHGAMLDEYMTGADETWMPGNPYFGEVGHDIKGGDAATLCNAFNQTERMDTVQTLLMAPEILTTVQYTRQPELEELAKAFDFSQSELRHWLLATLLGIPPWWTVAMDYETVDSEDWLDYFSDLNHPLIPTRETAEQQLQLAEPELEKQKKAQPDPQLAIDYAERRHKEKNLSIPYSLEEIFDELEKNLAELSESNVFNREEIIAAIRELTAPPRKPEPFSRPGKRGVVEHLITVVEALLNPEDSEMNAIAQSTMVVLDSLFRGKLLAPIGQLRLKKHKALLEEALAIESDRTSS